MTKQKRATKKRSNGKTLIIAETLFILLAMALIMATSIQVLFTPQETGISSSLSGAMVNGYSPPGGTLVDYTIEYLDEGCTGCNSIIRQESIYNALSNGETLFGASTYCTDTSLHYKETLEKDFPIGQSLSTPPDVNSIKTCTVQFRKEGAGGEDGSTLVVFTDDLEGWQDNVIWSSVIPHTDLEDHTGPFLYPTVRITFHLSERVIIGYPYYLVVSDSHDDLVSVYSYPIPGDDNPSECPDYMDGILYRYLWDYHDLWGDCHWGGFSNRDLVFWMTGELEKPSLELEMGKEVITAAGAAVASVSAIGIGAYRKYSF